MQIPNLWISGGQPPLLTRNHHQIPNCDNVKKHLRNHFTYFIPLYLYLRIAYTELILLLLTNFKYDDRFIWKLHSGTAYAYQLCGSSLIFPLQHSTSLTDVSLLATFPWLMIDVNPYAFGWSGCVRLSFSLKPQCDWTGNGTHILYWGWMVSPRNTGNVIRI